MPRRSMSLGACLAAALLAHPVAAVAAVSWPAGQLLPSFSPPAATQDLITLRYPSLRWEAEAPSISHATGHLDGDGWLCQAGIDAPDRFMVYGPYDASLPVGPNTANFRMKIDNNTVNNDPMVTIDVRDSTNGAILAARTITRQQFGVAGDWVTFSLPFSLPVAGHAIELRVYWMGRSYIKVDWVSADRSASADEAVMFASLKGVVNATRPRIFSYEGDGLDEGKYTWLQSLGLGWSEPADKWTLITKYRSEIAGIVVYDDAQPDTMNLATTIAGGRKALLAPPSLVPRLTSAPYSLPILVDLRGQFTSKIAVYQSLYNNQWPSVTHKVLIGLSPVSHKASLREYAVALGAAVVWLDPRVAAESTLLNSFLSSMGAGNSYMGWWPEEGSGVEAGSRYGIATVASDYSTNLTVHSGTSRTVNVKAIPPKPPLQNKIYVAFVLSDGDNLQFVEHLMRKLWNNPDRGKVPIGWTLSPAMLDAMPAALNYYWTSATTNDALISGPSGYGYTYPNSWPDQAQLDQFVAKTEDYTKRAGFRVVSVWNTIIGGINTNVGSSFATYAPSLLGLTAQNTGGGLTIYNGRLPGFAFSCNYCTNETAMRNHIASAAAGWNGASPRFILIQAQPWQGVTPTSFLNVKNSLDANYVVVRPDNWFQLLRQANGLPIEPVAPVANGSYRVVNKASGKCVEAAGGGTANGTVVQQSACNGGSTQIWQFTATGNGYYKVMTASSSVQGWDVNGGPGATGDGVRVQLWSYVGGAHQQWQPVWEPGGYYHLIARHSDKCLDLPGSSTADSVPLQQWTCNGTGAQSFNLTATPPPGTTIVNLSSAFNVNAAYSDGTTFPSSGGLDGVGSAYSSTLLGTSLTWSSTTFNFGPANQVNGVRNATVVLPAGQFAALMLLATGVNGDQLSQSLKVNYTDGTSSTFTQTLSNWRNASQNVPGQSMALSMAYRNKSTGVRDNRAFNLYGYSFALASTKTVRSLVLPANNSVSILAATLRTAGGAIPTATVPAAAPATATAKPRATATDTATATATTGVRDLSDFNGDGQTDLAFQHTDGRASVWFMNGMTRAGVGSISAAVADWQVVGTGDFDGDGNADVVWQHADGRVYVAFMNGVTQASVGWVLEQPLAGWRVVASNDFNGDGKPDLVWQEADGSVYVWYMDGVRQAGGAWVRARPLAGWQVAAAGDVNGDGQPDLVWQKADGSVYVWHLKGTTITSSGWIYRHPLPDWSVRGTGDFNGDGAADLVLQKSDGRVYVWFMNGLARSGGGWISSRPLANWILRTSR